MNTAAAIVINHGLKAYLMELYTLNSGAEPVTEIWYQR